MRICGCEEHCVRVCVHIMALKASGMEADRSVKEIMHELKLHLSDPMNQVTTSTSLIKVQLPGVSSKSPLRRH